MMELECQWRGPFYIWASNQADASPPKDCKTVYACYICSAQRPAHDGDGMAKMRIVEFGYSGDKSE